MRKAAQEAVAVNNKRKLDNRKATAAMGDRALQDAGRFGAFARPTPTGGAGPSGGVTDAGTAPATHAPAPAAIANPAASPPAAAAAIAPAAGTTTALGTEPHTTTNYNGPFANSTCNLLADLMQFAK